MRTGFCRAIRIGVGDHDLVDAGGVSQEPGVEATDPTGAEERDSHAAPAVPTRRRDDASTRRPIAALSDGGAQVVSCSTISHPA